MEQTMLNFIIGVFSGSIITVMLIIMLISLYIYENLNKRK